MAAISIPGVTLSQLLMHTSASMQWALAMYSTPSAMISREGRVEHPVVPHGDPVVDGDGVELGGETAARFDALFDLLADLVQVHVARDQLRERIGDADDRPAELFSRMPLARQRLRAPAIRRPVVVMALLVDVSWLSVRFQQSFSRRGAVSASAAPLIRLDENGLFFRVSLLNGEALLSGRKASSIHIHINHPLLPS